MHDHGKFELDMTAEKHKQTFMGYRKEGVVHPSKAAYQRHFSRMWEEGMSANDEGLLDANWTRLERVLAPYYFVRRNWTPKIFKHLDEKCLQHFQGRHSFN